MNMLGMNIGGYRLKKGELTIAQLKTKVRAAGIKAPKPVSAMRRKDWLSIRPSSPKAVPAKPKPVRKPKAKTVKPASPKPAAKKARKPKAAKV
jgi:hypothetical protein